MGVDVAEAGQVAAVILAPTILCGAVLALPRRARSLGRRLRRLWPRQGHRSVAPSGRPIETLAADLRRLLQRHDSVRRSTNLAMRARHLHAIEAAIGDCAAEAAAALGLAGPERSHRGLVAIGEVRRLLRDLAGAGLVLVPAPGLLAAEDLQD